MAHYYRGRAAAEKEDCELAIRDAWKILEAAKKDSDWIEETCDVIKLVIEKMKVKGNTSVESSAVKDILVDMVQNVFAQTDHGLIWAKSSIDWLNSKQTG